MSRTVVKTGVNPSRAHDHIYDPVYTASSAQQHLREHQRARMSHVERIPDTVNMFSELQHHPRHAYRMKESKMQTAVFPPEGEMRTLPHQGNDTIRGSTRYKYFKRPVVPFLHSVPAEILLAPAQGGVEEAGAGLEMEEEDDSLTRDMGIQTMYRETEAQTDPFTPDYITNPDQEDPEILHLTHLTYGQGLPASLEEVNMIHRMREKKAFEDSLPPITDEASFERRKVMLEEREMKEWAIREAEMRQEQEDKLQVLIETLREREQASELLADARVERVRQQKMRERDEAFQVIHKTRIKQERNVKMHRPNQEPKSHKRDIVGEHANFGSKVYAPVTRMGALPVKNQVVDYGIPLISNYQGLAALENNLPRSTFEVIVKQPKRIVLDVDKTRKGQSLLADLNYVDKMAEDRKLEKKTVTIENVYKNFEPVVRAPTPSVVAPPAEDQHRSVLLLQRLLRGRAIQNSMYAGKQKHLHLIRELRLREKPVAEAEEDPNDVMAVHLDTLQGEVVSNALDFIYKEIARVSEERKISALVNLAKHTRRVREAEESGSRQAQDALRKKREQLLKETLGVHSSSAERFLDSVVDDAIEKMATNIANKEGGLQAAVLNAATGQLQEAREVPENVVKDLVAGFVLPEVDKINTQRSGVMEDRRFADAATVAVKETVEAMSAHNSRVGTATGSRPGTRTGSRPATSNRASRPGTSTTGTRSRPASGKPV